jgi:hypothetical protein
VACKAENLKIVLAVVTALENGELVVHLQLTVRS